MEAAQAQASRAYPFCARHPLGACSCKQAGWAGAPRLPSVPCPCSLGSPEPRTSGRAAAELRRGDCRGARPGRACPCCPGCSRSRGQNRPRDGSQPRACPAIRADTAMATQRGGPGALPPHPAGRCRGGARSGLGVRRHGGSHPAAGARTGVAPTGSILERGRGACPQVSGAGAGPAWAEHGS